MRYCACLAAVLATALSAQPPLSFEVASVKLNKSGGGPANTNIPLGPGDVYTPTGGYFNATNFPLITYLLFAYKLQGNQFQYLAPQLPEWALNDRFDIQARAAGNPTKDEMRAMVRALLADRFQLKLHTEKRDLPVLAFVLAKPPSLGPQLRLHPDDGSCTTSDAASGETVAGGFPKACNGLYPMPPQVPGRLRLAARNVSVAFIADALSAGAGLGRPMVDQTGLSGNVDFILEFTPEPRGNQPPPDSSLDTLSITQAMRDQLGIKLESRKAPIDVLVVDRIERPAEN